MSMQPPPEVIRKDDFSNEEEYFEYYEKYLDYMFKTNWLATALTAEEFAQTVDLNVSLLIELHPDIRVEGPMGDLWYRQLRQMRHILNREVEDVDPEVFVDEFLHLYQAMTPRYSHDDAIWNYLKERAEQDHNTNAVWPDPDSYYGGPPAEVMDNRTFAKMDRQEDPRPAEFGAATDDHARIVLLSYIMRDMEQDVIKQVLAEHDAFVTKYNLLGSSES